MAGFGIQKKGTSPLLATRKKFAEGSDLDDFKESKTKFEEGGDSYKADKEKIKGKISKVAGYVTGAAKDAADVIRYTNPIIVTKKIATKIIEKKKKEKELLKRKKIIRNRLRNNPRIIFPKKDLKAEPYKKGGMVKKSMHKMGKK